ncbi:hypothetical protein O9X98_10245 [Agrobacterium salinitolerans]|nr:hypothetical protein [Agrobacterium salinitolerans]
MSSLFLWHGTPNADFDPRGIEPRVSLFDAVFLTGSPEIAAIYAGPNGLVHGYALDEGCALLRATGRLKGKADGSDCHYPTADQWMAVEQFLVREDMDFEQFSSLDSVLTGQVVPPLGDAGQPCWEALLEDLSEVLDTGEGLLKALGFNGFAQCERVQWALNDRLSHVVDDRTNYGKLCSHIVRRQADSHLAVAVFDAASLVHQTSLKSSDVASAFDMGAPVPEARLSDITRYFMNPQILHARLSPSTIVKM